MRHRARLMAQREQRLDRLRSQISCLRGATDNVEHDPDVTAAGLEVLAQQRKELKRLEAELRQLEAQPEPPMPRRR